MSEPTTERPAIAAAVIINDGQVLLVRRRVKEGELSWQFPAGQVEPGETGEQAAVRETQRKPASPYGRRAASVNGYTPTPAEP